MFLSSFHPKQIQGWKVALLAGVLLFAGTSSWGIEPDREFADYLLEKTHAWKGILSILGAENAELGFFMAETGDFHVHILDPDRADVSQAQDKVDREGLYGTAILVDKSEFSSLPYVTHHVNRLFQPSLKTSDLQILSLPEIVRVLVPEGIALIGARAGAAGGVSVEELENWLKSQPEVEAETQVSADDQGTWLEIRKKPLQGVDEWTHWEKTPSNNPVSNDQLIKAPYMTQYMAEPYYIAMPAITTAAGGRTFLAMGHIAHHEREEPWLNTLLARNGYNGQELWRMKLPDGYMVHRSAFIATKDKFYMIHPSGNGILVLDPETGDEIEEIRIRRHRGDWKWIALKDGRIYAMIGEEKDPAETTLVRSTYSHWSWGELSRGYYQKEVPWGFGNEVVAIDLESKEPVWSHKEDEKIDSRSIVMGGGNLFFYSPGKRLTALDEKSGWVAWTNENTETVGLIDEPGLGLTSTPGFRSSVYAIHTPEALVFQAQTQMNVVAVSTKDGSLLWHKKKTTSNPNMIYLENKLFVGIGEEGSTLTVDPVSGEVIEDLQFMKRACARLTATPDSLFVRAVPDGLTRYDRNREKVFGNAAMRPSCNDGVIGANGLAYIGPWLCDCNLSLMGAAAWTSAGDFDFNPLAVPEERFESGEGSTEIESLASDPQDWPTYRGNNSRTGASGAEIGKHISPVWRFLPETETHPTQPVIAGGMVFVAGRDGKVKGLDGDTGERVWTYRTGGPIMASPTFWESRVYVGSGDGFIYCLEAKTGRLLWRFRAAPTERRIMLYGSLCSTWPVNSGCLIHEGVLYAAAGLIDFDGTYVYALDAKTGQLKWLNDKTGHLDPELRKGVSAQGILAVADGRLWMSGGNVISPAVYDLATGEYLGVGPENGLPQSNRGEEIAIVDGKFVLHGGRLHYSATENVVNPGTFSACDIRKDGEATPVSEVHLGKIPASWDEEGFFFVNGIKTPPTKWDKQELLAYLEGDRDSGKPRPKWTSSEYQDCDTVAIAAAKNAVLAVSQNPIPRTLDWNWVVSALDREDGKVLWRQALPGPGVAGGIAIGPKGRTVIALADGSLVCYGSDELLENFIAKIRNRSTEGGQPDEEAIAFLQKALEEVHSPEGRDILVKALAEVGVQVGEKAKEAGYITEWHLLGPLAWDPHADQTATPINEPSIAGLDPIEADGVPHPWRPYVTGHSYGMVDLAKVYGAHENVAAYAYTEIELEEDRDLLLRVGSNDGYVCWFNGEEAGRFDGPRGYVPNQDTLPVKGKKGTNRILVKVTQHGFSWALGVRVTDSKENPVRLVQAP